MAKARAKSGKKPASGKPEFVALAKFKGGYVKETREGREHTVVLKRKTGKGETFVGTRGEAGGVFIAFQQEAKK